ncbi:MAG: imidazolonepropionase [Nitrososphaerota archaeon]|nr:imidazolonepropionase [Nitrososphaerota archaeon]MDG6952591.1 imidazolonepropionase [Nitrososphaerota archaeon]
MFDLALVHAGELVTCAGESGTAEEELSAVEDGALLVSGGKIAWIGTTKQLRQKSIGKVERTVDALGNLVTPGLVDPHTHAIFAGSREDELERKISGESYMSILARGGGILRTVRETRASTIAGLVGESKRRLDQLLMNGVTTMEVKTGYGLDLAGESHMLAAIRRLKAETAVELVPTFLGLHARPPGAEGSHGYVDSVIRNVLPAIAERKDRPVFSDSFCEEGVFTATECSRYLRASRDLGFALKIHADEFAESGGAALAAEVGCVSADHLGRSSRKGIRAMAERGVTAVLLPGTSLFSSIPYADARGISAAGCKVALGTDLSPNSWVESPQLVMSLGCTGMKMSPAQALLGFTKYAARAVARDDLGVLAVGSQADFVVHEVSSYRSLPYRVGGSYVRKVFKRGRQVYHAGED